MKKYLYILMSVMLMVMLVGCTAGIDNPAGNENGIEWKSNYYYYKGGQIPIIINEAKIVINIPKEKQETRERILTNVEVLDSIKDKTFDCLIVSRSDYERLTSKTFWKEDAKSVVLTFCYFTENNKEVYSTPYLDVLLKKKEDIDLLNSYVEKYKLRIAGKSSFTLWYILAVTPESNINPVDCANILYESGDFASAVPDLASDDYE